MQMHGVLEIPLKGLSLVLELAGGGSLRAVLSDAAAHPSIPWEVRTGWLRGIAEVCDHAERETGLFCQDRPQSSAITADVCVCF